MECLLMADLNKDKVAKAENLVKEKVKANLVAKVENAQLVMAQVWAQAPAQTMVAKAMVLIQEILEKVMLEIAQQEAIQMDLVHPVKALQVKMDKAHHPKYVANVMAQVVKHPLMTCLTTLEKKECLKLKRLLINRQQKISLNSKPNVVINAKSVLTWQKKPKTNVK